MSHRAGFVSIIGNPNVGKSTLTNALLGEKLVITSKKAQTTRHRILAFINGDHYQIVLSDTPGILDTQYSLHDRMMDSVSAVFLDSDLILIIVDHKQKGISNEKILGKLNNSEIPIILLVNKADLIPEAEIEDQRAFWQQKIPQAEVYFISALYKIHIEKLLEKIIEKLPESPPYFPKEQFTDKSQRFFASEIIRKHILDIYKQEIPYACEVVVDSFKEEKDLIKIMAYIYVERENQKAILIGKNGEKMKELGTQARVDMEEFFENKVFLQLRVKVQKNWRSDENALKRFGYFNP